MFKGNKLIYIYILYKLLIYHRLKVFLINTSLDSIWSFFDTESVSRKILRTNKTPDGFVENLVGQFYTILKEKQKTVADLNIY